MFSRLSSSAVEGLAIEAPEARAFLFASASLKAADSSPGLYFGSESWYALKLAVDSVDDLGMSFDLEA